MELGQLRIIVGELAEHPCRVGQTSHLEKNHARQEARLYVQALHLGCARPSREPLNIPLPLGKKVDTPLHTDCGKSQQTVMVYCRPLRLGADLAGRF